MKPTSQTFNPWPAGIALVLAAFVAGMATLVVIAQSHRLDLVAADYYEQELRYEKHLERLRRAATLPDAGLHYHPANAQLQIRIPAAHALGQATGAIHLYRPSAAGLDQHFPLALDAQGRQNVSAALLAPGLWKARVAWNLGAEEFLMEREFVVAPRGRETIETARPEK